MGFFFRKSWGNSLFRINLSKSGISYSVGVKGARVNFGNRGTYVNFGRHGIYYRKKISNFGQDDYAPNQNDLVPDTHIKHTITSGNVEKITDVDSQDFIKELTEKGKKISYFKWFGVYPLILLANLFFYFILLTDSYITNLLLNQPVLFLIYTAILGVFFFVLLSYLKKVDNKRLLVEIYYEIDDNIKVVYENFIHHFSALLNCSKVWQHMHAEKLHDYKYSSGADQLVLREVLSKISTNKTPSDIFKTNVEIPFLGLVNTELYFFPERLIIKRGNEFGAIMYKNIECDSYIMKVVEEEKVPGDTVVVGKTWRYLNKNGTPDKRFSNNYEIPICEYSVYSFYSRSGLRETISTSKVGAIDKFFEYLTSIGKIQAHLSAGKSG